MKIKKTNRILSLLLAIVMVAGIIPFSAISTFAAMPTDDASWTVVSGNKALDRYNDLQAKLQSSNTDTRYIRLDKDIKFEYQKYNKGNKDILPQLVVTGEVVLDLNGHKIDIKYYHKNKSTTLNESLFYIGNGSKLTVIDSMGKGKIHTDSYIMDVDRSANNDGPNVFNIFEVKGGELVINASGAEFECGRSKKQWVNDRFGEKNGYLGYARNQVCGSVVLVRSDSIVTVIGGTLKGRGYENYASRSFSNRCAAIKAAKKGYYDTIKNITVNIVDGTFYGKGCADAINVPTSNNNKITVNSGTFDVFKLDKVTTGIFGKDVTMATVADGSYGEIGIPDIALDTDNSDVVVGGHNYSEDEDTKDFAAQTHKTTVIKPKSNTKKPDDQIIVQSLNGANAWNSKDSFIINASNGRDYFSNEQRKYLEDDLQMSTVGYDFWTFTLYDAKTGKKCNAEPENIATLMSDDTVQFDIASFKTSSGDSFWASSQDATNYRVKVEVTEGWEGHNKYEAQFFNWYDFTITSIDINRAAEAMNFSISPINSSNADQNEYILYTDSEDGMEFILENGYDVFCDCYYRYYTVDQSGKTLLSTKMIFRGSSDIEYGDSVTAYIPSSCPGPILFTVEYKFKNETTGSYDTVSVTKQIFAMGWMGYDVVTDADSSNPVVVNSGNIYSKENRVELAKGETIIIKPSFLPNVTKLDIKDPQTGKAFDISNINWQYSVENDENGVSIWNDVPEDEIISYDVEGVTLPCVKTRRTAQYRIYCDWNGQRYYTQQPLTLKGMTYYNERIATLSDSEKFSNQYGKGENKLILSLNEDTDWYTSGCSITRILLKNVSKPDGAALATSMLYVNDFSGIEKNNTLTLPNCDNFFKDESSVVEGLYTFVAIVYGVDGNGINYNVPTEAHSVWYGKNTTDMNLYVNGAPLYEHGEIQTPYILPADTNTFDFTYDYYPLNSYGAGVDKSSFRWISSDSSILKIDEKTGRATALTPGTVNVIFSWSDNSGVTYISNATVSVPIAGFELNELDYSKYVGQNVSDVVEKIATVKSVWAYGGSKITKNADRYMSAKLSSWNGWGDGAVDFKNAKVSYNNNYRYGYEFRPNISNGYYFPVTAEADDFEIEYYVDTNLLECNGLDNDEIQPVDNYENYTEWNAPYTVCLDYSKMTYETKYENGMYIRMYHTPVIEDPDAVYLNEVNITINEPAVGDNRYEGTNYNKMNEYMVLNVSGVLGDCKADSSHSYVSKLNISNMRGTGKPYDDASVEDTGALAIEYMSVWNTPDYVTWYKPTKTYENGIYVHDVRLDFDSTSVGGSEVYVAKDANVFVNGRRLDFAKVYYSSDTSSVSFKHYFDVGEVETVSDVQVSGIKTPLNGETPANVDDCTVVADGVKTDDIYLSKLIWFVDKNGNGEYDAGEEAKAVFASDGTYNKSKSTLSSDGCFLSEIDYSLYVELHSDTIRISPSATILFDGINKTLVGERSGVFTFAASKPPVISGVKVSGTVTSFGVDTDEVIVQLIEFGKTEPAYEAVVKGNSASYSISNVAAGTYTMKVMKKDHANGEFTVKVANSNVTQNVKIYLKGDVNLDGIVSISDATILQKYLANGKTFDDMLLKIADTNGDGVVSVGDATLIQKYLANAISSFN